MTNLSQEWIHLFLARDVPDSHKVNEVLEESQIEFCAEEGNRTVGYGYRVRRCDRGQAVRRIKDCEDFKSGILWVYIYPEDWNTTMDWGDKKLWQWMNNCSGAARDPRYEYP